MKLNYLITTSNPLGELLDLMNYQKLLFFKDAKVQVVKSKKQCDYKLKELKINTIDKKTRVLFLLTIESDSKETLEELTNQIDGTFNKLGTYHHQELSSDLDKAYSKDIYPEIHDIENKLRAIITLVMTINTTMAWNIEIKKIFPEMKNKDFDYKNFFYNRNFDDLRYFLFKSVNDKELGDLTDELDDLISEDKKNEKKDIIKELKDILNDYKPLSFWDKYLKNIADKNNVDRGSFEIMLNKLYQSRCHVAHNNKFSQNEYNDTLKKCKKVGKILDIFLESITNISPKDSTSGIKDTLIVPANEQGFKRVFIGENSWYSVRISNEKIDDIKYIAAYQTSPISAVTYYAEVEKIVSSDEDINKKKIIFKNSAVKLDRRIELKNAFPLRGTRYTTFEKLMSANRFSELF